MAVKILLIRHGESEANIYHKFSGSMDVKLTEKGIWQAARLANRLQEEKIDQVYCSTLTRAKHTAEIVFKSRKKKIISNAGFMEMNFGIWEGLTYEEVKSKFGLSEDYFSWQPYINIKVPIPEGESIIKLNERVMHAFTGILDKHKASKKDETIAIVCHGGTIRIILLNALNMELEKIWNLAQDSTALNIIYYDNGPAIVKLVNDTSHLDNWWENDKKEDE